MLSQGDIEWIKANRAEMTAGRTEPVILLHTTFALDPYTKEPIEEGTDIVEEIVNAIWEEYSAVATVKDFTIVKGVDIRRDTAKVSFDENADLSNVKHLKYQGVLYEFLSINEKGLGEINRTETVVRRVY
jgi:hypothetical protein